MKDIYEVNMRNKQVKQPIRNIINKWSESKQEGFALCQSCKEWVKADEEFCGVCGNELVDISQMEVEKER